MRKDVEEMLWEVDEDLDQHIAVHRVQMNTFWNTTKGKNIANKGGLKKKKADDDDD